MYQGKPPVRTSPCIVPVCAQRVYVRVCFPWSWPFMVYWFFGARGTAVRMPVHTVVRNDRRVVYRSASAPRCRRAQRVVIVYRHRCHSRASCADPLSVVAVDNSPFHLWMHSATPLSLHQSLQTIASVRRPPAAPAALQPSSAAGFMASRPQCVPQRPRCAAPIGTAGVAVWRCTVLLRPLPCIAPARPERIWCGRIKKEESRYRHIECLNSVGRILLHLCFDMSHRSWPAISKAKGVSIQKRLAHRFPLPWLSV